MSYSSTTKYSLPCRRPSYLVRLLSLQLSPLKLTKDSRTNNAHICAVLARPQGTLSANCYVYYHYGHQCGMLSVNLRCLCRFTNRQVLLDLNQFAPTVPLPPGFSSFGDCKMILGQIQCVGHPLFAVA